MSRPPLVFRSSPDALDAPAAGNSTVVSDPTAASPPARTAKTPLRDVPLADHEQLAPFAESASLAEAGLDDFASEGDTPVPPPEPAEPAPRSGALLGVLVVGGIVTAAGLAYVATARQSGRAASAAPASAAATMGQAQFNSQPAGADVVIDGEVRGKTPLTLTLPVGDHSLEIRGASTTRTLPLTIASGVLVSQYVELLATPAAGVGRLEITSDPPGAQVSLDGVAKGITPLQIDNVDARDHIVSLTRAGATVYRTVAVPAGATAAVSVPMSAAPPAPGAVGGFLAFSLPFEAQVYEGGRLIGSTGAERLMVPTGRHEIELVNSDLQFRATLAVNVAPGRVSAPSVAIPNGNISINALPWAEVFVDGRAVGTTPLANLTIPIGQHKVTWRHPQLGERQQTVTVTGQTPVRVGVDFNR